MTIFEEASDFPLTTTWYGKDISTLSRKELEKAFVELGVLYRKEVDAHASTRKEAVLTLFKVRWAK